MWLRNKPADAQPKTLHVCLKRRWMPASSTAPFTTNVQLMAAALPLSRLLLYCFLMDAVSFASSRNTQSGHVSKDTVPKQYSEAAEQQLAVVPSGSTQHPNCSWMVMTGKPCSLPTSQTGRERCSIPTILCFLTCCCLIPNPRLLHQQLLHAGGCGWCGQQALQQLLGTDAERQQCWYDLEAGGTAVHAGQSTNTLFLRAERPGG